MMTDFGFDINKTAASFDYGAVHITLVPEKMRKTGSGDYELSLPDGFTAILSVNEVCGGAWTQLLRFEHRGGSQSGVLSNVRSFDRTFSAGPVITCESLTGDDCGETSFNPVTETLCPGGRLTAGPKSGRPSDTSAFPFFDLYDGTAAATFGIGWSGQWILETEAFDGFVRAAAGLSETRTFLYPGEAIRTASVFWVTAENVGGARRKFRRLMLDRFSPRDPRTGGYVPLPVAETNFDRYFRKRADWDTVEGQKRCADIAEKCHMDTLWLDAAWFREGFPGGVGNFGYAPGFPNGTGEVADYAHSKGLRYVQWFEPERANAYSDTLRYHRDDVIIPEGHNSVNNLVNIGDGRVRRRVTDEIKKHIENDRMDIYRQDFNICPLGYWRAADKPGRNGMTEIRFVEGNYEMWDEIRRDFPNVLIDNCASGGRRIDFETCRRSVPLWRSDTGCFEESAEKRTLEWSQNQMLALTRYLPYHSSGTWSSEPYAVRSVAAGGVACNFDVFSPDFDADAVVPVIDEVKRLRKYWYGDFYPLTEPSVSESVWAAWQLSLGASGAVYAFRRKNCNKKEFASKLSDIDSKAVYSVTVTYEDMSSRVLELSGAELSGFVFELDSPRSSAVLEYEKKIEKEVRVFA